MKPKSRGSILLRSLSLLRTFTGGLVSEHGDPWLLLVKANRTVAAFAIPRFFALRLIASIYYSVFKLNQIRPLFEFNLQEMCTLGNANIADDLIWMAFELRTVSEVIAPSTVTRPLLIFWSVYISERFYQDCSISQGFTWQGLNNIASNHMWLLWDTKVLRSFTELFMWKVPAEIT